MIAAARTDTRLDRAREVCEAAGGKLTDTRRDVLRLLIEADDPVAAYTLLDRLKAIRGGATPPTVYRALNFLMDIGLVHRIERLNAFVACADAHEHAHAHAAAFLICGQCGGVTELEDHAIDGAITAAARARGFVPRRITVEVEGLCGGCAGQG
jgi:Fur family zinc uptake transcriptional regulator